MEFSTLLNSRRFKHANPKLEFINLNTVSLTFNVLSALEDFFSNNSNC